MFGQVALAHAVAAGDLPQQAPAVDQGFRDGGLRRGLGLHRQRAFGRRSAALQAHQVAGLQRVAVGAERGGRRWRLAGRRRDGALLGQHRLWSPADGMDGFGGRSQPQGPWIEPSQKISESERSLWQLGQKRIIGIDPFSAAGGR